MSGLMPLLTLLILAAPAPPDAADKLIAQAVLAAGKPDLKGERINRVAGVQRVQFPGKPPTVSRFIDCNIGFDLGRNERRWTEDGREHVFVIVSADSRYKSSMNGGPFMPATPAQSAASKDALYLYGVIYLDDLTDRKLYRLEVLPPADVDGEACDRVRVKSDGREDIDLSLSAKTHLLRQWTTVKLCGDGVKRVAVETLSAHKVFSGVTMATVRKLRLHQDMSRDETIESVEFLPADQAGDLFTRP